MVKNKNKRIEKLCSFYVSDWHFITMLLPYLNQKIDENAKVVTILEKNIEEKIKKILGTLKLKNESKMLELDWSNFNSTKYIDIENTLNEKVGLQSQNVILINGCKEYMEQNNSNIEKWFQKSKVENLKVIDFFEVTDFNNNIMEILDNHDKILNTSGEKEIEDVFEGYKKGEEMPVKKVVGNN